MKKKYNKYTKGYKIDVFYNKVYQYSTDIHTTCKAAKERFKTDNPTKDAALVRAFFDKQ